MHAAVPEDFPHQAQAGQEGKAEPPHPPVDSFPDRQQDQVCAFPCLITASLEQRRVSVTANRDIIVVLVKGSSSLLFALETEIALCCCPTDTMQRGGIGAVPSLDSELQPATLQHVDASW